MKKRCIWFLTLFMPFIFMGCCGGISQNTNPSSTSPIETFACSDGSVVTDMSACPNSKPSYHCPDGSVVSNISSCPTLRCTDGTRYSECSLTKPNYCKNGDIIENSPLCGCSEGYEQNQNGCKAIVRADSKCNFVKKQVITSVETYASLFDVNSAFHANSSDFNLSASGYNLYCRKGINKGESPSHLYCNYKTRCEQILINGTIDGYKMEAVSLEYNIINEKQRTGSVRRTIFQDGTISQDYTLDLLNCSGKQNTFNTEDECQSE
jgi:hypothetical protein